jgi:predicted hydrolase (HD superfamily)
LENSNRRYEQPFKQVLVKHKLYRRIKQLAFNNGVEMRLLASACLEYGLNDEKKLEEIIKALKAKK